MTEVTAAPPRPGAKGRAAKADGAGRQPAHKPPAQEISAQLIDLIQQEVFLPGERLREQDLANRFGVTRARVREALHILEARGFVEIQRMKGASVAKYDPPKLKLINEVRAALTSLAVRHAARDASPEEREAILEDARALYKRGADMSPTEFHFAVRELGARICRTTKSEYLLRILFDVHRAPAILRTYATIAVATRGERQHASKLWLRIAQAVKAGDAATAAQIVDQFYAESWDGAARALLGDLGSA